MSGYAEGENSSY